MIQSEEKLNSISQPMRQFLLRGLGLILLGLLIIASIVLYRAAHSPSTQLQPTTLSSIPIDRSQVLRNLSDAIQCKTIASADDIQLNADQFHKLHKLIQSRYPHIQQVAKIERINELSLLLSIEGSQPKADGILLLAHQDVVPISTGTESEWNYPPFSGLEREGFIWGRGAWDNKSNLMSQLEALEILLTKGFRPQRTLYLAFGADEEVLGLRGAAQIAATLQQRGVHLQSVLDEGLLITHGMLPGLDKPAALIGIAEKGYLSVELTLRATAGHSSMPPASGQGAIAKLGRVVEYLDQHPRPIAITGVARQLFETVAPEMQGPNHYALSNLWLFGPVVQAQLQKSDASRALLQTTTAITMAHAGNKENVLPGQASLTINFRLLPGDDVAKILQELKTAIKTQLSEQEFTLVALPNAVSASKISPTQGAQYQALQQSIQDVFPNVVVAPGLMLGATDSAKFAQLSDHIYRFSPVHASDADLPRFHGSNERIAIDNYLDMIRFYHRYLSLASQVH